MTDQQIGLTLVCGVCCAWPLLWAAGAWWLRGWISSLPGGQSLWGTLQSKLPVRPEKEL